MQLFVSFDNSIAAVDGRKIEMGIQIQYITRMVQLSATAAIEYVAACCITRTRTRTKTGTKTKIGTITKIVPGCLCPFPPSSMLIRTV